MTSLHERLRWLRHQHGRRLSDVAEKTSLSVSFLSDLERGRTVPSLDALERIANVYDLTIGELLVNVRIREEQEE